MRYPAGFSETYHKEWDTWESINMRATMRPDNSFMKVVFWILDQGSRNVSIKLVFCM
jgi:hypothetical protein